MNKVCRFHMQPWADVGGRGQRCHRTGASRLSGWRDDGGELPPGCEGEVEDGRHVDDATPAWTWLAQKVARPHLCDCGLRVLFGPSYSAVRQTSHAAASVSILHLLLGEVFVAYFYQIIGPSEALDYDNLLFTRRDPSFIKTFVALRNPGQKGSTSFHLAQSTERLATVVARRVYNRVYRGAAVRLHTC